MKYQEIKGNILELAFKGEFDVIAHPVNCFGNFSEGLTALISKTFNCDTYPLEQYKGDINKLGQLDYWIFSNNNKLFKDYPNSFELIVVNAYTHYHFKQAIDCYALVLCLKKLNKIYAGKRLGLPLKIGNGSWNIARRLIRKHLANVDVIIVFS